MRLLPRPPRHNARLLLLLLPMTLPPLLKHLIEIILEPPDIRAQPRKLPLPPDLLIPMLIRAMRVPFDFDLFEAGVRVLLVRHAQLVPGDDFVVGDALPLGGAADEVLRAERGVAEDGFGRGHGDEVGGGHGVPFLVEEGPVVDVEGWGDAFGEAGPVLRGGEGGVSWGAWLWWDGRGLEEWEGVGRALVS